MINRESYYLTLLFNSERSKKSPCAAGRFFTACIYQDTLNYSSFLCFFLLTNTITKVKEKASKTDNNVILKYVLSPVCTLCCISLEPLFCA